MKPLILNVGNDSYVLVDKILSIGGVSGNFNKNLIKIKKDEGKVIDYRQGKGAKSIVFLDNGYIVLSIIATSTLKKRLLLGEDKNEKEN